MSYWIYVDETNNLGGYIKMIHLKIIFRNPNLKSYEHDFTEKEASEGIEIEQDDKEPFPLIRRIDISRNEDE